MHMGDMAISFQSFWGLSILFSLSLYLSHSISPYQVYVVYLGLNKIHDPILTTNHHLQLLSSVFARKEDAEKSILYSYKRSFSGFSAMLNSTQASTLAEMDGVMSVFRSTMVELHTTRSWDFLGLNSADHSSDANPLQLAYGDDVIVAVFDSGIWPESDSFREEPGTGPIPKSWKGECVSGDKFDPKKACNRKLIGARYYFKGFEENFGPLSNSEYRSARDYYGHGTHTASTAVGQSVKNASFLGIAQGTARGGAPRARLAVYKTCWSVGVGGFCSQADIMAAFDDALSDGVDVISASFGLPAPLRPFFATSADIGSFHAAQQGVSVVFSGGNDGPDPSLVDNVGPWSICVAASSIDRTFPSRILLDNNLSFTVTSFSGAIDLHALFTVQGQGQSFVIEPINAELVNAREYFAKGVCREENWNKKTARGKVILCFSTVGSVFDVEAVLAAFKANASALIFAEPVNRQVPNVDIIPTIRVDIIQGTRMYQYVVLSGKGRAVIVQISPSMTVIKKSPAPVVAIFSSRGPNSLAPDILKPDITAPGVNILAAWPPKTPPTLLPYDRRSVNWNILSGTSMSCPHVSGVVALLKSAHPDWSPAAIRSALMTTAYTRDSTHDSILYGGIAKVADPFDIGAGHIDPMRAMDPGLVYDLKTTDYILFLCNIGYTVEQIKGIVKISAGTFISCPKAFPLTNSNLNYPSITVSSLQSTMTLKRTVRNVGRKKTAIYFVSVVKPNGVEVKVWPRVLIFSCFWEELSYYVTLKPEKQSEGRYDFGEIIWSEGFHSVRSPLVVLVDTSTNDKAAADQEDSD